MALINKILGYRDFSKLEDIKNYIASNYSLEPGENILTAEGIIIFQTSRQKTWLIASEKKLFCVLDDIENDSFEVRWQMSKTDLFQGRNLNFEVKVNPNYSPTTGSVDLGNNHKEWLYSKKLYRSEAELKNSISDLILSKMNK